MKGHHILYINFRCEMEQYDEGEVMYAINCEANIVQDRWIWEIKLFRVGCDIY